MGKLDTFLINFDQPLAVYFPGQMILGFVELTLKEPVRMRGKSDYISQILIDEYYSML